MKLSTKRYERIHVLHGNTTPSKVLRALCESGVQEEPFYVCDIDNIVFKYKQWKSLLPRVIPHYAVKCNDNATVLEVLAALGTGFDCASKVEIDKVLDMEVDPSRIIFANTVKQDSHIHHAAAVGVNLTTFDNATELHKIKRLHPTSNLLLRFRCDAQHVTCNLGIKFGCDPVKEGPQLLSLAHDLGLNVVGVSFHVGSDCKDPPAFRRAIAYARDLFDFGIALGTSMNLLDVGGGYPGDDNVAFATFADVINLSLDHFFPNTDIKVIAEPGSYFVGSAFTLATKVHSKREIRSKSGDLSHIMYYINDGVFGSFSNRLYKVSAFSGVPLNPPNSELVPSSVWGVTCDGIDKVEDHALLPLLSMGEWLIYHNLGAYSLSVASPFNGFPIPKVHAVSSQSAWLLLKDRMPSPEELFVQSNCPAHLCFGLDLGGTAIIAAAPGQGVLSPWAYEKQLSFMPKDGLFVFAYEKRGPSEFETKKT